MISLNNWNLIIAQMNLSTEKKIMDMEKGEGEEVGWTGSLGLVDGNDYIWSGYAMRSCGRATLSRHVR